ncbi:SMI1/KNR4 family protein [Streptomyces sp. ICBB 8177]|nr:SMI1/KNR4 family protein [Streptomyces sp. ICBB 8177]
MPDFPLTVPEWREFLSVHSAKHLASKGFRAALEERRAPWFTEAHRDTGWLGREPASEAAVAAAEERLGVRLPPTYRNFLLVSNGWNSIGLLDLREVEEIGWFTEKAADLLDVWEELEDFTGELAILRRCLLISVDEGGSGGNWLLHADSVREDGEWTAYEWWPCHGGDPKPYEDFAAMAKHASDAVT